jgi:arginine N-succinyltransferase
MFLLRSAVENDLEDLFRLSKLMTFINLPADRDIIRKIISSSIKSFSNPSKNMPKENYLFVLEDLEAKTVIGTSMIHAQHGTEDEPHFFLRVGRENKFSTTINTGFIHGTLKFGMNMDGPTEIGGLILDPSYRGNPYKLGKILSFVRFLYMGLNPGRFKEEVHSELMPPFDSEGKSPLWEAIGRRFLNMDYIDADVLSRSNKEFILSLYPSDTIYEALLPMEARNALGKVGKETQPVKKMLESIGFEYTSEVDPFDGGPHYRAKIADLKPVQDLFSITVDLVDSIDESLSDIYLMTLPSDAGKFQAIRAQAQFSAEGKTLLMNKDDLENFGIQNSFLTQATILS